MVKLKVDEDRRPISNKIKANRIQSFINQIEISSENFKTAYKKLDHEILPKILEHIANADAINWQETEKDTFLTVGTKRKSYYM